ncbi:dsDNA nuclease domain-containing protein [Pectobacterium sp. CHL-2024]|uniref:dsDNA nuclease domain-containing protein n=1 Tax=Pectobacterium sp. CHL-2024 TaxID=3377079 RepID=UPI00380C563D
MAKNKAINAGVDALTGFEFQRNCALYLLLDNFNAFVNKSFFICIEHHDDFLFCFKTDCLSYINEVHAYQAKKLSGRIWTIDARFSEVVSKILLVGDNLRNDSFEKSEDYKHQLTFISNTEMELKYAPTKKLKNEGVVEQVSKINEQNSLFLYEKLHENIKNKIEEKIAEVCSEESSVFHRQELGNLFIQWVDFPRTAAKQKESLIGLMSRKFPHIVDPKAAIDVILNLFRNVETVYNQGQEIRLLDPAKRVEGEEVKKVMEIIDSQQKAFDYWRAAAQQFSVQFKIPMNIQKRHRDYIINSFELLKDMSNYDYQIIKSFIRDNDYTTQYYTIQDILNAYAKDIRKYHPLNLNNIDVFFAVLCSYVECYD